MQIAGIPNIFNRKAHLLYIDTSKYAVLNFDPKEHAGVFSKTFKAASLTADDIRDIEKLIKTTINHAPNHYQFIDNPRNYYKQFITIINSKGEKEVWVNCFCHVFPANFQWKKHIHTVKNGGSCYFQLKINLTKNIVYDFGMNGVA